MTRRKITRLTINGIEEDVAATTIAQLLAARGIDPAARFLAVAVNGAVVRRGDWLDARLEAGDAVEVVRPLQGG
jgi:sulfur carrier protein